MFDQSIVYYYFFLSSTQPQFSPAAILKYVNSTNPQNSKYTNTLTPKLAFFSFLIAIFLSFHLYLLKESEIMPILYSLIARGSTVLSEHTTSGGNFPTITRVLLNKIKDEDGRMSYIYDSYMFHYIVENHITYLCMSDDSSKTRIAFTFLEDIMKQFQSTFGTRAMTAIAFSLSSFNSVLQKRMDYFNSNENDTMSAIHTKIEDVKQVMVKNIDMIMERGEKLEILVEKADKLNSEAFKFERSSRSLKNAMLWKRIKLFGIIFLVLAIIIFIICAVVCDIDFSQCK